MKKTFTLFLMVALVAGVAMAAPQKQPLKHLNGLKAEKIEKQASMKQSRHLAAPLKKREIRREASASDLVLDQPAGDLKLYNTYAEGFEPYIFWIVEHDGYCPGRVVFDGKNVWFGNIISSLQGYGWVKGTLSDDGKTVTVQFPQAVATMYDYVWDEELGEYTDEMVEIPVYVGLMKKVSYSEPAVDWDGNPVTDDNGDPIMEEYEDMVPVEDPAENVVTYTVDEDGVLTLDGGTELEYDEAGETVLYPESMIGAYYFMEGEAWWLGYGECFQEWEPLGDDVIFNDVPDGLKYEQWEFSDLFGNGRFIQMAKDGNDVYLTNIWDEAPEAVIKGSVDTDGSLVFPSRQYVGIDLDYNLYQVFYGADLESEDLTDEFCFEYDAQAGKYVSGENDLFVLNSNFDWLDPFDYMLSPSIYHSTAEALNAAPQNPEFSYYEDFQEAYGQDYFEWVLPIVNVEGAVMDKSKVYFNVYINDELYTFYNDEYEYLEEDEITDLPYGFADEASYDIASQGSLHAFYIFGEGIKSFGIKMYYENPAGELKSSDLVTYLVEEDEVVTDAVENVAMDQEVAKVVYTNLQGMRVSNPQPGDVYIQSRIFKDGSRKSVKVIKK